MARGDRGIKCDNAEAARSAAATGATVALACGRAVARNWRSAQTALLTLIQPLGVHLRATHVHGHNRAEQPQQRAIQP